MRKFLLLIPFLFLATFLLGQSQRLSPSNTISKKEIKIYPNPAFNFIGLNSITGVSNIIIYNLVGRKMKKFTARKGEKYNITDLPKGMYLVQLLGEDGKIVSTKRMSKK